VIGDEQTLNNCYIAGAGEFCKDVLPGHGDFVIAADGGFAALTSYGVVPDLVIGDFDSLEPGLLSAVSDHPNVIRSSAEKDDTDMMLAVKHALNLGYRSFIINGGLGGRLDQTLANIQILVHIADNGACGTLVGHGVFVSVIKNGEVRFSADAEQGGMFTMLSTDEAQGGMFTTLSADEAQGGVFTTLSTDEAQGGTISIFSARDKAEGVTLRGLKYLLVNATLACNCPLGVSNEFIGVPAVVSVREGTLIIIRESRQSESKLLK